MSRTDDLEQQLGAWPSARPPQGVDEPTVRAEVEWLKLSAAWQNSNGIDTARSPAN